MPKRSLPSICLDEHLPPEVTHVFAVAGFRVIRASESRYRGRDERDYLHEMYSHNEIFVTADAEFMDHLVESGFRRHAGIVWLPSQMDQAQRLGFAELAGSIVKFQASREGVFAMRGLLLYPEKTGVMIFDGVKDHLVISWDRLAA